MCAYNNNGGGDDDYDYDYDDYDDDDDGFPRVGRTNIISYIIRIIYIIVCVCVNEIHSY